MTRRVVGFLFGIAIVLSASRANAQGLSTYNWSGWYAGLNAGGTWGEEDVDWIGHQASAAVNNQINQISPTTLRPSGFTGGGQIGFNYQTGIFVGGAEADIAFTGLSAQRSFSYLGVDGHTDNVTQSMSSRWLSTLRARFGIASGSWLLYATAGGALANLSYNDYELVGTARPQTFAASSSETKAGFAAGGGFEWALARKWSVRAEYLYVNFGSTTYTSVGSISTNSIENHHSFVEQLARIGLNYHFNEPDTDVVKPPSQAWVSRDRQTL